jgi:hypothetical protein
MRLWGRVRVWGRRHLCEWVCGWGMVVDDDGVAMLVEVTRSCGMAVGYLVSDLRCKCCRCWWRIGD